MIRRQIILLIALILFIGCRYEYVDDKKRFDKWKGVTQKKSINFEFVDDTIDPKLKRVIDRLRRDPIASHWKNDDYCSAFFWMKLQRGIDGQEHYYPELQNYYWEECADRKSETIWR